MPRGSYTIEEFVHDITEKLNQGMDVERLLDQGSTLLERLIGNPDCIPPEYKVPSGGGKHPNRGSYLLHRSPELLVTTVVWGPGDHVGPHDHHTWGMIGVLENELHEVRFRRLDDGSRPDFSRLEKDRQAVSKQGEVSLLIPDVDEIHQIDNPDYRPTVEIHVYGRDLATINRCQFDLETGAVTTFGVGARYDNE